MTSRVLTAIQLEKVESLSEIMKHKVMATPAVVVDNIVVHTGGIPSRDIIESWL
ncbi:thioredoxin family protein [Citrobacter freundii]|uniref:thioredoxin family protein n=1 Tax=Citrobacter freundii TaxID=546 RepID=UPI003D67898F